MPRQLASLQQPLLRLAGGPAHPGRLAQAASEHGLLLLWLHGDGFPGWAFPESARPLALTQLAQAMKLQRALCQIARALDEARLPFLCYKGPALSLQAYGAALRRPSGDLDLWLDKRDIPRACRLLGDLGYQPCRPQSPLAVHLHFAYEYALEHPESGTVLELHWQVVPHRYGGAPSYPAALARSQTVYLEGQPLQSLSLEDSLVILAAHGAKHLWYRLLWLYDLAGLLQGREPDWSLVARIARDSGNFTRVSVALLLLESLFAVPLSPRWRVGWRSRQLAALLLRLDFLPRSQTLAYLILLGLEDGLLGGLRSLASLIFHPSIADISYPRKPLRSSALYYAVRPWRYLMKWSRHRPAASEPDRPAPANSPGDSPPEPSSGLDSPSAPA